MWLVHWYWDQVLGIPLNILERCKLDVQTDWKVLAWKIGFTVGILVLAYEIYLRLWRMQRRWKMLKDSTPVPPPQNAYLSRNNEFIDTLEAVNAPEQTIAALKKAKRYDRLGEIYIALTRHKDAAWAFKKAGDLKRSAAEWAKAGYTLKAAQQLEKIGDYATAAQFYLQKDKPLKAARAYRAMKDLPNAAAAFAQARRFVDAANALMEFFADANTPTESQIGAALQCAPWLQDQNCTSKLKPELRKALLKAVALRLSAANRADTAAQLYCEAGEMGSAGDLYLRSGKMQEAVQCLRAAGRDKEAMLIGARYHETRGAWKEAGTAYENAAEWMRAGDCFSKAADAARAAACYERAGEFFGAGFALAHAQQWEKAIPLLQKVAEAHPRFTESRALLGRAFYELGQYEQCVAALENHLTGERVRSNNMDYFWMLALAYEQLGKLDESRQVLLRIQSVNLAFRDVDQRLSNIESRISMTRSAAGSPQISPPVRDDRAPTAIMNMVEHSLGNRYRLEDELGRGGMGVVYKAHDTQLDRTVALKFLGTLLDESEEYRKRFLREAQTAAKVSHPNIVAIFDIGVSEGKSYIAMEYVNGISLHRYIEQKSRLPIREALNIMGQICGALDAIHQAGIIHRDIKPDNILLGKGGLVKLMDFGLAKGQGGRITGTNVLLGTPCYMAPEQINGATADARSDIYALGLVLHEMLTGQIVFSGQNVLQKQLTEVPPAPGKIIEGIPPLLDQIVMKAIAKVPDERFQSVRELAAYLRQVKE